MFEEQVFVEDCTPVSSIRVENAEYIPLTILITNFFFIVKNPVIEKPKANPSNLFMKSITLNLYSNFKLLSENLLTETKLSYSKDVK